MQGRFKREGTGSPQARQGRGEAAANPEPRGTTDRGSSPQRAHESGPTAAVQESGGTGPDRKGGGDGGAASKSGSGPGTRMALRNWRISTRLVSLLALPVVAATTLGALRIQTSLYDVDQLDNMKRLTEMTEQATELAAALQEERDRSAGPLVGTGNAKDDTVVAPREKTDQAFQAFKEATGDIDGSDKVMAGVQSTVLDITRQLTAIKDIRERAYENPAYVSQSVNSYNQLIESLLSLSQDMAQATSNSDMIQSTRALAAFSTAKEYASIQRAIISAGLARKGGPELSESDRLYAKTASESERASLNSFGQIYGEERAAELTKPLDGGIVNITSADKYRDRVLQNSDGITRENRSYMDWYDQDRTKIDEMSKIEATLLSQMEQQARELRSDAQQQAFLNGAVILLVLGISLVGAFVVARSMVRSLRRLQDTAQDVARKRLPELVKQMSEAEPHDVDTSVESVGVHSRDEIGRVAAAFDDVHREAVRLAGEQALLRGNVNAMFTNLSRRSQGLIQRQLSLISELESREADPDQLSSLFKLDHLATRMRRNGENLLVLAGEEPGRRWTRPVPLVDVLRAAASEVEQYERIELNSVPNTEVAGRVVNDLVHLLAELLENATSFSSPQTKVKVTGHALPDGRVLVEIHDTGIGLSPEDLSAINERLANPPTVDVSVSRRMGLFVVGRLSLRHGIRIQLRPSDSGGTTALVMLPVDVAQGGAQAAKGKPGTTSSGMPGGSGGPGAPKGGGGLAAALQRGGPGGAGPGTGAGAGSRLGALPPRGQVAGGAQRPALPGSGDPGRSGAPAGVGSGSGGDAPATDFFGSPRPSAGAPQPTPPRPGTPGEAPAPSGASVTGRQGPPPLPSRGGPAGELPGAPSTGGQGGPGDTGEFPRPQTGGPGDAGEFPRPQTGGPGDTGEFPRPQPSRGPGDTAEFARPDFNAPPPGDGEGWRDGIPVGEFPRPEIGGPVQSDIPSDDQGEQVPLARPSWASGPLSGDDAPRGHEDPESTGEFARPGYTSASGGGQNPAGQDRYPAQAGQQGQPGQRQYEQHQDPHQPQGGQDPHDTGEFAVPGLGQGQSQDPHQGQGQSQGHGQQDQGLGPDPYAPSYGSPDTDPDFGIPSVPPAAADAPTPIFASMESNWFRTSGGSSGAAAQPEAAPQNQQAPQSADLFGNQASQEREQPQAPAPRPGQAASAVPPMPQRQTARGTAAGGTAGDAAAGNGGGESGGWGASPNDEVWRRAEQVRQPAAGGVTTSGLPRRVPRANLVAGTAQQQSTARSGPQVSRAPDDVRGRLTNLRRGIQQGRQAGNTDGRGLGPTYQQER
ncbi:nitrate- and nitrite sensing domain-containing protein [Streptomyces sp. NPDC054796]